MSGQQHLNYLFLFTFFMSAFIRLSIPFRIDTEKWVDLTYPLSPETPVFSAVYEPMKINWDKSAYSDIWDDPMLNGTFVAWRFLEFYEHTGTHIDAPSHFSRGGKTEDQLTWDELTGPLVVIDVRHIVTQGDCSNFHIEAEHLQPFIDEHGPIEPRSFVILNTGWGENFWTGGDKYYAEATCLAESGVDWFLENAPDMLGFGIDALTPECLDNESGFRLHYTIQPRGQIIIENVKSEGMEKLPPKGAQLMIFPMHLKDGTGSPSRLIAVNDQNEGRPSV